MIQVGLIVKVRYPAEMIAGSEVCAFRKDIALIGGFSRIQGILENVGGKQDLT